MGPGDGREAEMVTTVPRKRIAAVVATAVALSLAGPLAQERAEAITEEGRAMRRLINRARVVRGKPRLKLSDRLTTVAQRHSKKMAAESRLHHNSNLAKELSSMSWSILGENVGVGASVRSLHRAFMNSRPHRKNNLRRSFRKVGVGTVFQDGRLWVTVVFSG